MFHGSDCSLVPFNITITREFSCHIMLQKSLNVLDIDYCFPMNLKLSSNPVICIIGIDVVGAVFGSKDHPRMVPTWLVSTLVPVLVFEQRKVNGRADINRLDDDA